MNHRLFIILVYDTDIPDKSDSISLEISTTFIAEITGCAGGNILLSKTIGISDKEIFFFEAKSFALFIIALNFLSEPRIRYFDTCLSADTAYAVSLTLLIKLVS